VLVRLTGLVGAAHLNGREGVLRGRDPGNSERFTVSLVDSDKKDISVRSRNYELVAGLVLEGAYVSRRGCTS
jgi:hypothetical protein